MRIGGREFDMTQNAYIMGILNVTPDSFSDGGRFTELDRALFRVEEMIAEGMELLDIGGESTRPGFTPVSEAEEIERTAPVIEAVRHRFDVPISLDTYKAAVAEAGIAAGADLINDIHGLRYDDGEMAALLAKSGLPCVLMYNGRGGCGGLADVLAGLRRSAETALAAGIGRDRILLDPGIGFAGGYENDLLLLRELGTIVQEGFPVLLGVSRKSVIGQTLGLPREERLEGTLAATVYGAMQGVAVFRVHDVKENARALRMALAMKGTGHGYDPY